MTARCAIAAALMLGLSAVSCARPIASGAAEPTSPPALLLGEFQDDYGERHTVSPTEWHQRPANRYHIVRWSPSKHFLIAQNDAANRGAAGKWTRIDWVPLDGMAPYEWAFCFSAYEAATAAAAESVTIARPETPRTGCNGFPFTRMRRPAAR